MLERLVPLGLAALMAIGVAFCIYWMWLSWHPERIPKSLIENGGVMMSFYLGWHVPMIPIGINQFLLFFLWGVGASDWPDPFPFIIGVLIFLSLPLLLLWILMMVFTVPRFLRGRIDLSRFGD